jgi:DNA-binding MarR family transcriptional regulator
MGRRAAATADSAPRPLTSNLCWLLSHTSHALTTELSAALYAVGVSPRAHAVLTSASGGRYTQIELARLVGLDKTTMVSTIDELESAGLVQRLAVPDDRRARVIDVTEAGADKLREADAIVARVQADVLGHLAADERTTLLQALTRLASERLVAPVECAQPVRRRRLAPAR